MWHEPAELETFLAGIDVLGALGEDAISDLAAVLEPVHVAAGTVLLRQGTRADCAYVIRSGRLRATLEVDGTARTVNEIGPGALIGEMGLLTNGTRTASVHALRDSEVLRLGQDQFQALVRDRPEFGFDLARQVIERLVAGERRSADTEAKVRTIAVVPAGVHPADVENTCRTLGTALTALGPTAILRSTDLDDRQEGALIGRMHEIEQRHRCVLYQADPLAMEWSERCLRQADRVILVATAGDVPRWGPIEELMDRLEMWTALAARRELVLVHDRSVHMPSGTDAWLRKRPGVRWHHVRRHDHADHARVGRAVTGRSVGLVLGGGGPRGFAHLGVMRALDELGIQVDEVGGTSIGAVMGASHAMGWNATERASRALESFGDGKVIGLTLPVVALSSARELNRRLRSDSGFGDVAIEDMWLPYFCISANLSRAEVVVHDRGPLWRALRASVALPGILPPVQQGSDLLVDGGVIDNLPVDVMRERIGDGVLIAVDVEPDVDLRRQPTLPDSISGWRLLARRLNPLAPSTGVPGLVGIVLRAKEVGGRQAQRERVAEAGVDLVLRPPTGEFGALDFTRSQTLIESGYTHALDVLRRWPRLADLVR